MGSESSSSCFGNGKAFPPGFRFHPTDEELVLYYLKRKICRRSLRLDIIAEVDVYKWDPDDLPGQSKLKTGDRQWFFFSPRDRKYPNGARSNRATLHGYWKATGKDRIITCNSRSVGVKKTLVFYIGRAPSGQRTDWVMHEYTLDEDELKRCRSAHDYYALYKVFKKSGPGPKNGEQYGAPFKEEEWDEDCVDFNGLLVQANPIQVVNPVVPVANDQEEPLTNYNIDEPPLLASAAFNPVTIEEETQGSFLEQQIVPQSSHVQYDVQAGFDLAFESNSHLQQQDTSEVTSMPNIPVEQLQPQPQPQPQPQMTGEEFLEDFLEMDDLKGPEPITVQNFENPVEEFNLDEFDGLCEFDLYQDPTMFSNEMALFESEGIQQSYINNVNNEIEGSCLHSYVSNPVSQVVDCQFHDAYQSNHELWTHDQQRIVFTPEQATQGALPSPSSGVVVDGNSAMPKSEADRIVRRGEDDGSDSWFSSALWAFVESIPTTPASASESSALVNRAFVRMSSFTKGRANSQSTSDAAFSRSSAVSRRSGSSSRGIIYFSILGVLLAILWILIRSSFELLGRCISY